VSGASMGVQGFLVHADSYAHHEMTMRGGSFWYFGIFFTCIEGVFGGRCVAHPSTSFHHVKQNKKTNSLLPKTNKMESIVLHSTLRCPRAYRSRLQSEQIVVSVRVLTRISMYHTCIATSGTRIQSSFRPTPPNLAIDHENPPILSADQPHPRQTVFICIRPRAPPTVR
jgi:hypothetical protein